MCTHFGTENCGHLRLWLLSDRLHLVFQSPWYNRTRWLGVKHQLIYLPVFQVSNLTEWRGHSRLYDCLTGCIQSSRYPTWQNDGGIQGCVVVVLQDVSSLPGVQRDRGEPGPAEDVPQPPVHSCQVRHLQACRVPDWRHFLCACMYCKPLLAFEIVCFEDVPWECRSRPLHFCYFAWCVRKSCSSIVSWAAFVPLSFHYRKKSALRKSWSMGCVWIIWLNIMWNIQWREVTNNCNKSLMV